MDTTSSESTIYKHSRLLGKNVARYTCADLRRLLQEWGVAWTSDDDKIDLARRVHKYVLKHPSVNMKERIRILKQRLDAQPYRYQVWDQNNNLAMHSYHPQVQNLMKDTALMVVADMQTTMLVHNMRGCISCKRFKAMEHYPNGITTCCDRISTFCSDCLEKDIEVKLSDATYRHDVTCTMCDKAIQEHDMKALSGKGTFDK